MDEYESELMNIFNIIWKRKWLIIIPTLLCVILAGVISFLLPPKWEVEAIIYPSRFTYFSRDSILTQKLFLPPKNIAYLINRGTYNNRIATNLSLDIKDFPELNAEDITNTILVKVSTKEKDIEKAKSILNLLCNQLKRELDSYADHKIKEIDSQIKSKEMKKSILEGEINSYKNRLNIIKQREQEIEKEMSDIRKRIEELEKERRLILNKKDRSESERLAILLYSDEIQHNSMNHNILNEFIEMKTIKEDTINLEIKDKERQKYQIENEINDLNESKRKIHHAQIIKEPTSSTSPVSPKKKFNILIAGILGLVISTLLAFTLEYLNKFK